MPPPRSFQRTRYRPGELAQFDLVEPRSEVSVGFGQTRRGWVVTCELPYSRAFVGALVFSKEFADIAFGMTRCLRRLGALPGKLVWDREGAIAPKGRPTESLLAFCGQLVGVRAQLLVERGSGAANRGRADRRDRAKRRRCCRSQAGHRRSPAVVRAVVAEARS